MIRKWQAKKRMWKGVQRTKTKVVPYRIGMYGPGMMYGIYGPGMMHGMYGPGMMYGMHGSGRIGLN